MTDNTPLKRFAMFFGNHYYPAGGWGDFQSSHDTLGEAEQAKGTLLVKARSDTCERPFLTTPCWWHIVDLQSGKIIQGARGVD